MTDPNALNALLASQVPDPEELYQTVEPLTIASASMKKLTTADAVRAAIGISESELPDSVLGQSFYARGVERALQKIDPTLVTRWPTLIDSTDPADLNLVGIVQDFAMYKVAGHACQSIELLAARTMTDSKATFQRFEVDLETLLSRLEGLLAQVEDELLEDLGLDGTTYTPLSIFVEAKPTFDPVTGEGG